MRHESAMAAGALFVCIAVSASTLQAANPRSVPIGGRTATMGGAGTAAGNDSAMPYLNPAGLAGLPGDVFAVSASLYGYSRRGFTRLFYPNGTPDTYLSTEKGSTSIAASQVLDMPSSVMYVQHLPSHYGVRQVLGMALVIPSRQRVEIEANSRIRLLDMAGSERQNISASVDYTDYYVGPTYALSFEDDRIRLGASVFALYTQWFRTLKFGSFTSLANDTMLNTFSRVSGRQASELSIVPVAGAQFHIAPSVWAGLAVAAPSVHLWGKWQESFSVDQIMPWGNGSSITKQDVTTTGVLRDQKPLRINAGVAYDNRESFSIAADVHFYAARKEAYDVTGTDRITAYKSGEIPRELNQAFRLKRDVVTAIDASLGAEFVLSSQVSLRAGGFTDLSNNPKMNVMDAGVLQIREHRYGGTLGLGLKGGSFDTTFGAIYAHSAGDIATFDLSGKTESVIALAPTKEDSILFVFSGQVTTDEARDTIKRKSPIQVNVPGVSR